MITPTKYILLVLLLILSAGVLTQGERDTTSVLIDRLYKSWKENYTRYSYDHLSGERTNVDDIFYGKLNDSVRVRNFIEELKNAEANVLKREYGIDVRSAYMHNLSPGESDFDNSIYRSRFTSEVGWNILRSGYIHNQIRAQIASNEGKIAAIEQEELNKSAAFALRWNHVIYLFNLEKIKILDERLRLAQQKIDVVKQLYFLNKVDQEELLKHLESLAEIRSMYTIYKDFNDQLDKQYQFNSVRFDSSRLPLIDLNYDYILQQLKGYNHDSIVLLAHENIDLSNRFLNEVSLKAFMRYSYYDLETLNPPQRDFVSVGVSLGVPINLNRKYRRDYMEIQKENIAFMPEDERIIIEKGILSNYYEFRYKRKQFTSYHYKKLLYKELLRKQSARFAIDYLSFNPVQSLRLVDDMMKIDIEMLDLKQQMYLKLLSIHVDLPFADINELYQVKLLDEQLDDIYSAERGVYIWDKTFIQNSVEFIQSYIEKQEFQHVIMSFSQAQEFTERKKQLVDTLSQWGIGIELMTGRNSLINDENPTAYFDEVMAPLDKEVFNAIHLDVEPHTFDDWQLRKEEYLTQYVHLLEIMRDYTRANNLSLTVSIPLHYPKEYMEQIYDLVDKVYFMAYENVKTDYIVRKIKDYPQNKTVVALRTEDFSNLWEIELKMIQIQSEYTPLYFVINDLRRLIDLEKR